MAGRCRPRRSFLVPTSGHDVSFHHLGVFKAFDMTSDLFMPPKVLDQRSDMWLVIDDLSYSTHILFTKHIVR